MFGLRRGQLDPRKLAVFLACAAQFLSALNMGIGPLMIPRLSADLGFGQVEQAWVVSGYALAFAGFVLLGGRLADVFGGARIVTLGFYVATLSAAVAACSPTTTVLIGARIGQGLGAALTVPAALAIIATTHQELSGRSRALATFAASGAVGFGLGLACGGLAADTIGWRWLFVALGLVSAVLAVSTTVAVRRTQRKALPVSLWSSVSSAAGLMLVAYAVTVGSSGQGAHLSTVIAGGTGLCFLGLFLWSQGRSQSPIMPLELWTRPGFALNIVSTALIYGAWVSAYYFAALLLQDVLGLSGTAAALFMAPLALGATAGSRIAGVLLPRVARPARLILSGSFVCAVATGLLALPSLCHPWLIVILLSVVVAGQSTAFVALNVEVLAGASVDEVGLIGSVFNAGCQVGGGMAVGTLAALSQAVGGAEIVIGCRVAFLCAAALALLAGIAAFIARTPANRPASRPASVPSEMVTGPHPL
ncbi:MFS transporter [Rhodococcus sp. ACS1]|uniref:MFS transporter n=1 Tax=Rhodococcus sp. ACS1 TaxID=2028570 RepID=UPI0015C9FA39|nr:MFS transporter [Rhodococcus sp. ACS1]